MLTFTSIMLTTLDALRHVAILAQTRSASSTASTLRGLDRQKCAAGRSVSPGDGLEHQIGADSRSGPNAGIKTLLPQSPSRSPTKPPVRSTRRISASDVKVHPRGVRLATPWLALCTTIWFFNLTMCPW